ncbi:MAG TPA: adenylate/guanylate cyclase domain-containing protein [Afifellaceae bacterium]|nr:adenylate/guanylate cyclase domain-containing protein [Afifellaceae bacterium]
MIPPDAAGPPLPRRRLQLPGWVSRLAQAGIVASDPEVRRRQAITNIAAYVAAAGGGLFHLVGHALHDFWGLLPVHLYNLAIATLALIVPRLHRFGENVGAMVLVAAIVLGHAFVVLALGRDSDLQFYYLFAGAMLFLFGVRNWRLCLGFFAFAFAVALLSVSLASPEGFLLVDDHAFRDSVAFQALANGILINAVLIGYALTALWRAEQQLAREYERSEGLLLSILPASIAARLKSGRERHIADRIDKVTVLFADLVGFTPAAHRLPPEEVVVFIDGLFSRFDAACQTHGIDKIKTIGDAYMAVGGLRGEGGARAEAAGLLALEMQRIVAEQPPLAGERLALRIGIHCGPAVAGVIGRTRLSYDVWGDAVNVAARMESHGEPGRIQVSEAFVMETRDAFRFRPRGSTEVKGLGPVTTFFLVGPRDAGLKASA